MASKLAMSIAKQEGKGDGIQRKRGRKKIVRESVPRDPEPEP